MVSSQTRLTHIMFPSIAEMFLNLHRVHMIPQISQCARTHDGFIGEANQVQFAITTTLGESLATKFGIKGIPLLSSLGSLSFPASFPYDFMHLVWENLIPNLVLFWAGCFKELSHEGMGYALSDSVWNEI